MLSRISSHFPQLTGFKHDLQDSLGIRSLVGSFEADNVLPATSCGNVHVGQVFPFGGPFPPVGMPKATFQRL